ncbi:hypothetical protein U1Q18_044578 [Sarracenia purpurea var. burkii]
MAPVVDHLRFSFSVSSDTILGAPEHPSTMRCPCAHLSHCLWRPLSIEYVDEVIGKDDWSLVSFILMSTSTIGVLSSTLLLDQIGANHHHTPTSNLHASPHRSYFALLLLDCLDLFWIFNFLCISDT